MKLPHFIIVIFALLSSCASESSNIKVEVKEKLPDLYSSTIDSIYSSLSFQEKINQLIWVELNSAEQSDSVIRGLKQFKPGGIYFSHLSKSMFTVFPDSGHLQPFFSLNLIGLFDLGNVPFFEKEFNYIQDTVLINSFADSIRFFARQLNLNELNLNDSLSNHYLLQKLNLSSDNLLLSHFEHSKSKFYFGKKNKKLSKLNIDQLTLDLDGIEVDSITHLLKQNDLLKIQNIHPNNLEVLTIWRKGIEELNLIQESEIEEKVRKVIALKLEKGISFSPIHIDSIIKKNKVPIIQFAYLFKESELKLFSNEKKQLPLIDWPEDGVHLFGIGTRTKDLEEMASNFSDVSSSVKTIKNLDLSISKKKPTFIFLEEKLDSISARLLLDKIDLYNQNYPIVLVNLGNQSNLSLLDSVSTLINVPYVDEFTRSIAVQAIFGGVALNGELDEHNHSKISTPKVRLAYCIPEAVGFDSDSLKRVDQIAREAVWSGVTPGCQVWTAKNGRVIYHKAFGFHTYDRNEIVRREDVYDIASVTKVAATALAGMSLYDQGKYKIQDSLKDHLPDSLTRVLKHKSRLYDVTFKELFTHTSGMPAGLPIYQFIAYVDSVIGKFDRYYCNESNSYYCVEVAKDFYLDSAYLDSMWLAMHNIWPGEKKYKYSDANFNILYQVFRQKIPKGQSYDRYLDSVFYKPMHLRTMGYLPMQYLDTIKHRITPTEYDAYWRYQLLKGFVHDPNAALYGGVAGNAGLFSNANDLGVLFQMLLNGGTYGSKRYLTEATVKRFTNHQEGSHRGLGFDKPTGQSVNTVAPDCPKTAYGHTGFTGICAWADPENELVFVFTSNRVYPDPNNKKIITYGTRKRIHQVFYDQLK